MSPVRISESIGRLVAADKDTTAADYYARSHYLSDGTLLWVHRTGVTPQADTLLAYLKRVGEFGFSQSRFYARQIEEDLNRVRDLDFSKTADVNAVVARLDYYLTKSYLRYAIGQRYGFVSPDKVLNKLDVDANDTLGRTFRKLYDVDTERIGIAGSTHLLKMIAKDSVCHILREAEPRGEFYHRLKSLLQGTSGSNRLRVLVNMERCRWRHKSYPTDHDKYVVVNIPAYSLIAVDGDDVLQMKMVCGSRKTKTPLLNSEIMRMDLNPKWIIPSNIVKHEMAVHVGDADYFLRNNYVITDRTTGEAVPPEEAAEEMFRNGGYRVAQTGGEGNSLGRIIFRFNNNFAIYLHDTPTRGTFNKADRSASHGCVRVEKPYDLACFLLKDKSERLLDKIRYSMQVRTKVTDDGDVETVDKSRLLHSVAVEPRIPLFITYLTIYPMPDGRLLEYDDVYGYDSVIAGKLREYTH